MKAEDFEEPLEDFNGLVRIVCSDYCTWWSSCMTESKKERKRPVAQDGTMIIKALDRAMDKRAVRGWDKIYVAIDWHDTICKSTS